MPDPVPCGGGAGRPARCPAASPSGTLHSRALPCYNDGMNLIYQDPNLDALPRVLGFFELIFLEEGVMAVAGWLLDSARAVDEVRIFVNGRECARAERVERADVPRSYPHVPGAGDSGFRAAFFIDPLEQQSGATIHAVAYVAERPIGMIRTLFEREQLGRLRTPPAEFMTRVANVSDPRAFVLSGTAVFSEFLDAFARHAGGERPGRVLDWGCGSGRVTQILIQCATLFGIDSVVGCDIDKEAVAWCAANLEGGSFETIGTAPPTRFADGSFDTILGYSVCTHLGRDDQTAWLGELRRILRPGGTALITVHGPGSAALHARHEDLQRELADEGISDAMLDPNLDSIAPEGYYRAVYQTEEYTRDVWGKQFNVVDYRAGAMNGFQDLVVLK